MNTLIRLLLPKVFFKNAQFSKDVKELFALSKNNSKKIFSFSEISDLPKPVQLYFRHVLKEGQPEIQYARIKHNGTFKTGRKKDWVSISGDQYFTTFAPGFIWKGKTSIFTAIDKYVDGKGSLLVSLLSVFNVVDGRGPPFNQGELLRWLGESVWFPTNLLPSKRLRWSAIDYQTAQLTFNYNGLQLIYIVTFNDQSEITQIETQRYMDKEHLETWIGKMSDYKSQNGCLIPTKIEAIWKLADEDFSYAQFNLKEIDYDIPKEWPHVNT